MRRTGALRPLAIAFICALVAESVATSRPTTGYSRLYVFGDSYSDIGAGYIDGNGPTLLGYGMMNQVRDFTARVRYGEIAFDSQATLFFLAGGLNEFCTRCAA